MLSSEEKPVPPPRPPRVIVHKHPITVIDVTQPVQPTTDAASQLPFANPDLDLSGIPTVSSHVSVKTVGDGRWEVRDEGRERGKLNGNESGVGGVRPRSRSPKAEGRSISASSPLRGRVKELLLKMVFCCCWPIHKCVTVLSLFDTVIVGYFAYKAVNLVHNTFSELYWVHALFAFILVFFFVCQCLASIALVFAHKKGIARYCWPRLVLIAGLIVCTTIVVILMVAYFSGAAHSMNNFVMNAYEFITADEITEQERKELSQEMRWYSLAFFLLAIIFDIYCGFEFFLTMKFYKSLEHFQPVPQDAEPTAPPAFNPDYPPPSQGGYYKA